jgi:hypothetical protein
MSCWGGRPLCGAPLPLGLLPLPLTIGCSPFGAATLPGTSVSALEPGFPLRTVAMDCRSCCSRALSGATVVASGRTHWAGPAAGRQTAARRGADCAAPRWLRVTMGHVPSRCGPWPGEEQGVAVVPAGGKRARAAPPATPPHPRPRFPPWCARHGRGETSDRGRAVRPL